MAKRFKITQADFLNWLISDTDDIKYWGKRFTRELLESNEIQVTTQQLFDERSELPGHLFTKYFDEAEIFSDADSRDIPIEKIELIE